MYPILLLFRSKKLLLFVAFISIAILGNAQLKIGDNPTSIQKSSILELESTRQGLLLPRLADTAQINALNPPDGMIIYLNGDKSLRLRSNGQWKKIADLSEATANWSLTGNAGTDPSKNFIGTVDGQPLVMRTNNNEALRIDASGNIGIGTAAPTAKLNVDGSVKFENLAAGTNELSVLVLNADGSVYKRTMSSSAFENAIKAINGIQKQTLSITAQANTTKDTVEVENRAADSTIAIYMPVQDGASGASKPYGFLTFGDWQKIQSAIQTITIGAVAATANASGASINTTGTSREIVLHPADATNPGIITAGTQTIGGDKTLQGNTTLNGTLTLNSVANNNSSDSVLVMNNGVVEKRQVSSSAFGNAIRSLNGNRDTAQTIAFTETGTDLTISTNGTNTVNLNVPSASASARGVVTTAAQTFGGTKTFQDSVTASKAMMVGGSGNANSTVQIDGSVAMAIKAVTGNYTVTAADNTVLANTTAGAFTITLPAPTGIAGRIYTIKKIGTGGIDNQLTITPSSATIDGGSSYVIYNDWTFVTLQTDGSNWYIIKK
jgi:hypothetical protein